MWSQARVADERVGWSRVNLLALAALLLLLVAGLATLVHPWYDRTEDGSVYLLTSRALAAGEGYSYLGSPFRLRPPGLPLLFALVSGGELAFHELNLLVACFGAATLVLLFVWIRPRLGGLLALAIAVSIGALPGFQRLSNQMMTDVPGAALLLACVLLERWSGKSASPWRQVALGALVGLSSYFRSGLGLLLPAIVLSRIVARVLSASPPWKDFVLRRLAVFSVVAILVMLPWSVRNRLSRPKLPVDQSFQYSAWTLLWNEEATDPSSPRFGLDEVIRRTFSRLPLIVGELGRLKLAHGLPRVQSPPATPLQVGLGLCLCAGLIVVWLRRREPGETFVVLHCLSLAALPMEVYERYMLPVLVFALPAAVELARDALRLLVAPRIADGFLATTLFVGAGLCFDPRSEWDEISRQHTSLVALTEELAKELPADARLGAPVGWHLQIFLGRPVYSLRIATSVAGAQAGAEAVIDRYDLDMVVIIANDSTGEKQGKLEQYFASEYQELPQVRVPGRSARIFRVRP